MSEAVLRDYVRKIETYFRAGNATEHTYRATLQGLLESLWVGVSAINEPKRSRYGAPDYAIARATKDGVLTVGYVEAKDIGKALDSIEHDEQISRYLQAIDNLLLTDYCEFRWYVNGEKQGTARLATLHGKQLLLEKDNLVAVEQLLASFLQHSAEPIRKPDDLARRMARLTYMVRDIIIDVFAMREASATLSELYETFKIVLLPDLSAAQFADMFAQTLAYGLFAACYNHKGPAPFARADAAREIPKTNPFLRKLFSAIAGADFEDEPFIGFVNELTQVLSITDMDAVLADFGKHTRQEDPIVHFYETFLTHYDPRLRELRGVYYTPQPVVSYIVRSVDELLRRQFDCPQGLADTSKVSIPYIDEEGEERIRKEPRVLLLDPACGTGTFAYAIIDLIRETFRAVGSPGLWAAYVHEHLLPRLVGFELLMAPYAVAHLKLGMQLAALDLPPEQRADWAYDFRSNERLHIYLTNTLEQVLGRSRLLLGGFISDEANEAARIKQESPVMVVLGNPPYSGLSANKSRWMVDLLHGKDNKTGKRTVGNYFEVDGKPLEERNSKWLNDDYVKFMRFAQWRIEQTGYGILAFITNHGYLDNPTFRGMRQSLMKSFDEIYVLDLHGNSKKRERSPDGTKDENVFDIQQGVAIGIFVKHQQKPVKRAATKQRNQEQRVEASTPPLASVYHAQLWGDRERYEKVDGQRRLVGGKYYWLAGHSVANTQWTPITPQAPLYLFIPQNNDVRAEYEQGWKITDMQPVNVLGFQTHRDQFAIDFDEEVLRKRIEEMRSKRMSDHELAEKYGLEDNSSWNLHDARLAVRADRFWQSALISCFYRPFDRRYCYFSDVAMDRPRVELRRHMLQPNLSMNVPRQTKANAWRHALVANTPTPAIYTEIKDGSTVFPLYLYPRKDTLPGLDDDADVAPSPSGRRPNLAPAFIQDVSARLKLRFVSDGKGDLQQTFGPEDVFSYMYAIFHSPTYRVRYSEFLKTDFPRLPVTSQLDLFRALCRVGERLVSLHLMEHARQNIPLFPVVGNNVIEKIDYAPSSEGEAGRIYVNKTQYFANVSAEVWEFYAGGYQVCHKWLKDRKGRTLSYDDLLYYQSLLAAIDETLQLMDNIDETIATYGGWPIV